MSSCKSIEGRRAASSLSIQMSLGNTFQSQFRVHHHPWSSTACSASHPFIPLFYMAWNKIGCCQLRIQCSIQPRVKTKCRGCCWPTFAPAIKFLLKQSWLLAFWSWVVRPQTFGVHLMLSFANNTAKEECYCEGSCCMLSIAASQPWARHPCKT